MGTKANGISSNKLKEVKNLEFYKFLGTGGGQGFSLWPDFSMYAFLGVWKNRDAYKKCFDSCNIFRIQGKSIFSKGFRINYN